MKHLITLFLACWMLILSGCSNPYSLKPTRDGLYEFGIPEIGIYFVYDRGPRSGTMTAVNETGVRTYVLIQRSYGDDEWGEGKSFTLESKGKYIYYEYYPKGTKLLISINRDGVGWSRRVNLD